MTLKWQALTRELSRPGWEQQLILGGSYMVHKCLWWATERGKNEGLESPELPAISKLPNKGPSPDKAGTIVQTENQMLRKEPKLNRSGPVEAPRQK